MSGQSTKECVGSYETVDVKENDDQIYKFPREFTMGCFKDLSENDYKRNKFQRYSIAPHDAMIEGVLFDRPPESISFKFATNPARSCDYGLRCITVDKLNIGTDDEKNMDTGKVKEIRSSDDNYLWFSQVVVQTKIVLLTDDDNRVRAEISFISLTDGQTQETHTFATPQAKQPIPENVLKTLKTQRLTEKGRLLLTGALLSNRNVIGLQFVDLAMKSMDDDHLLDVYRMSKQQGIHPMHKELDMNYKYDATLIDEQYLGGLIGFEDGDMLALTKRFSSYFVRWIYGDPIPKLLPHCLKIFDRALDGDVGAMHTVFAMNRFFNHCIQTNFESRGMKEDPWCHRSEWSKLFNPKERVVHEQYLVKLNKYFSALSSTLQIAKRIIYYTPSLNIYMVSSLLTINNKSDILKYIFLPIITFVAQLGLFILVVTSIGKKWDNVESFWQTDISIIAFVSSFILTFIVTALVIQQCVNTIQFRKVFPDRKWCWTAIIGYIINVLVSICVIFLNFFVIITSEELLDIVLNSVAILFILELDDQMVNLNTNDEKAIYISYLQTKLMSLFHNIDKRYVTHVISQHARQNQSFGINRSECEIEFDDHV